MVMVLFCPDRSGCQDIVNKCFYADKIKKDPEISESFFCPDQEGTSFRGLSASICLQMIQSVSYVRDDGVLPEHDAH